MRLLSGALRAQCAMVGRERRVSWLSHCTRRYKQAPCGLGARWWDGNGGLRGFAIAPAATSWRPAGSARDGGRELRVAWLRHCTRRYRLAPFGLDARWWDGNGGLRGFATAPAAMRDGGMGRRVAWLRHCTRRYKLAPFGLNARWWDGKGGFHGFATAPAATGWRPSGSMRDGGMGTAGCVASPLHPSLQAGACRNHQLIRSSCSQTVSTTWSRAYRLSLAGTRCQGAASVLVRAIISAAAVA